jgi:hypothetical protein
MALGELSSLEEARAVVRASFEPRIFEPTRQAEWEESYARIRDTFGGGTTSGKRAVAAQ